MIFLPIGENLALMSESATREQSMRAMRATFPNLRGSPLAELRNFILVSPRGSLSMQLDDRRSS